MRGRQALPHGLEWNLAGESFVAYVPIPTSKENCHLVVNGNRVLENIHETPPQDTPAVRKAIVNAHNRWCFAKDLPFRSVHEIEALSIPKLLNDNKTSTTKSESIHYYVKWKEASPDQISSSRLQSPSEVLQRNPSATGDAPPAEVWINGVDCGVALEPSTLPTIVEAVGNTPSLNLSVKMQSSNDGDNVNPKRILRIERYFRGGLRRKQDIFDHLLDNLYALEDV
ncbi:MAG: hypothetical protein SGARI_007024, partial [Bacillariaceae sp.]